jgi:hypothetical protein
LSTREKIGNLGNLTKNTFKKSIISASTYYKLQTL